MPPAHLPAIAPAVVVGLDCITGLQTARILAARSIPVMGIVADRRHFCAATRACSRLIVAPPFGPGLVEALRRLGRSMGTPAVLFPCTDAAVHTISGARSELEPFYPIVLPDHPIVELLMDKLQFAEHAQAVGLPVPVTFALRQRADALEASEHIRYPAVLKPAVKDTRWFAGTKAKAFRVDDRSALLRVHEEASRWADTLLLQEWVHGSESNLYSCNAYLDRDGTARASFVARKLRQWPPETGTSSLGEEVRDDVVLQGSMDLFRSVPYRGLGYVEIKRDTQTGRYLIIEPNVGRPTGRSAIAEKGGVELLLTAYRDALGLPLPEQQHREQRYRGVKWIYWRHDAQAAAHRWRHGELSLPQWYRSVQGPKVEAVFSLQDPMPFIGDLWNAARVAVGRRRTAPRGGGPRLSSARGRAGSAE